jgi:hypothetical protein
MSVPLRELAHARAGDKGELVNVSVIAFHAEDFARLERILTIERVTAHLGPLVLPIAKRYVLPQLNALNFVFHKPPGGGVTRTLALDAHGKSLSFALLEMEIPENEERT